jgi:hypothetical protein
VERHPPGRLAAGVCSLDAGRGAGHRTGRGQCSSPLPRAGGQHRPAAAVADHRCQPDRGPEHPVGRPVHRLGAVDRPSQGSRADGPLSCRDLDRPGSDRDRPDRRADQPAAWRRFTAAALAGVGLGRCGHGRRAAVALHVSQRPVRAQVDPAVGAGLGRPQPALAARARDAVQPAQRAGVAGDTGCIVRRRHGLVRQRPRSARLPLSPRLWPGGASADQVDAAGLGRGRHGRRALLRPAGAGPGRPLVRRPGFSELHAGPTRVANAVHGLPAHLPGHRHHALPPVRRGSDPAPRAGLRRADRAGDCDLRGGCRSVERSLWQPGQSAVLAGRHRSGGGSLSAAARACAAGCQSAGLRRAGGALRGAGAAGPTAGGHGHARSHPGDGGRDHRPGAEAALRGHRAAGGGSAGGGGRLSRPGQHSAPAHG